VFDVTADWRPKPERVGRFLAAPSDAEALGIWLALAPGEVPPSHEPLRHRLARDVATLDALIAHQVDTLLHDPRFQQLEATWRGLHWLCECVEDPDRVHIKILDLAWRQLVRDMAIDFDHSSLFKKVYSNEFGMPGGQPFGVLLGDYAIHLRPSEDWPFDDVGALHGLAQVAAAAFAPFLCAPHPSLFGLDSFGELARPIDFERVFRQEEYLKWNALRAQDDARFVGLLLPRILLRKPWSDEPAHTYGFRYEEGRSPAGQRRLFGNPIWAFGAVLVRTFTQSGWLAGIRGVERGVLGGGLVVGPVHESFLSGAPGSVPKPITEVVITDEREKELADLGFIPLAHCHGTSLAAFYSVPSAKKPELLSKPEAAVNARLSTMLHYMLCVSRFAHYLKVIGRDKVGSYGAPEDCERELNDWLHRYTNADEDPGPELAARLPLREARAEVRELPGKPGAYSCVIHLRPHFQLDQMSSSIKLVTELAVAAR
jgi:type VI secretion system ImpC/EvpB family protein